MKKRTTSKDPFNDPIYKSAIASLTDEQKEKYKKIGEEMYNSISYETGKFNPEDEMKEAAAYISSQLDSGIHPSFLESNEKKVMEEIYGKEWYKKWGYDKKNLKEL